jgi:hypothetical protein
VLSQWVERVSSLSATTSSSAFHLSHQLIAGETLPSCFAVVFLETRKRIGVFAPKRPTTRLASKSHMIVFMGRALSGEDSVETYVLRNWLLVLRSCKQKPLNPTCNPERNDADSLPPIGFRGLWTSTSSVSRCMFNCA